MKASTAALLWFLMVTAQSSCASRGPATVSAISGTNAEQEVLTLSREKWRWMAERKADTLAALFHDEAVFVHMGGTMTRAQELDVIRSGSIQYKNAEIQEASVRFVGATAIVLNRIRLTAVVGGNEVVNPVVVTEATATDPPPTGSRPSHSFAPPSSAA